MLRESLPLVTIGIPTYNRAGSYLRQALESAVNQTYTNIEIVVSDNCSPDDTEAVVKSLPDPRIRYFKHPHNMGATKNFAFCLQQAGGEYFLLLHDDDLIDPDFIETCINALPPGGDTGIVRTGTREIDAKGMVRREIPNRVAGMSTDDFFTGWFHGKTIPYLCSTLFHTERLKSIGGFQSKHHHFDDLMAEVRLAAQFGRADVQYVKASFRIHDGKRGRVRLTSAAEVKNWCEDSIDLLDLMCELAPENKGLVRAEGMRFLSHLCYRRAAMVRSLPQRFLSYPVVFEQFRYRYFPPVFRYYRKRLGRGIRKIRTEIKRLATR